MSDSNKKADENEVPLKCASFIVSYARFVYRFPWAILLIVLCFVGAMTGWMFGVYGFKIQAVISNYRWSGTKVCDTWDAFLSVSTQTYHNAADLASSEATAKTQSVQGPTAINIYERKEGNILDVEALKIIWEIEDKMVATPGYTDFCYKQDLSNLPESIVQQLLPTINPQTNCTYFQSFIVYLKRVVGALTGKPNPSPSDLKQEHVQYLLTQLPESPTIIAGFISKDFKLTPTPTAKILRSMFTMGYPLNGYRNVNDRNDDQKDKVKEFGKKFTEPIDDLFDNPQLGIKGYNFLEGTTDDKISAVILHEVLWLIGSFGFVIVFATFHIKSIWVSFCGVLGTFFSIPCAIAFLFGVITIHHFDALNVIALFLICGIGSDSLFIVFDNLVQSEYLVGNPKVTPELRLGYAVQEGALALGCSIGTTAISFLALCLSGFKILQYFGIFCFLELFFSLVFALTWYVAILALWMRFSEFKPFFWCCMKKDQIENSGSVDDQTKDEKVKITEFPYTHFWDCFIHKPIFNINSSGLNIEKYNAFERFFHDYWSPFIYLYRFPILTCFVILTIVMGVFTFKMESEVEIQYLSNDHQLQRTLTLAQNNFVTSIYDFSVIYLWGVKGEGLHVSLRDNLTPDRFGTADFLPLDISTPDAQRFLLEACDVMINSTKLIQAPTSSSCTCPILILRDLANSVFGHFPLTQAEFKNEAFQKRFREYLYIGLGFNEAEKSVGSSEKELVGFDYDTNELKYIGMKGNMIIPDKQTSPELKSRYELASELENQIHDLAENKYKLPDLKGYQTSYAWVTMDTQDELGKQALEGVCFAVLFSIIVIFLITMSFFYTFMFLISVVSVILTITGILYNIGWKIDFNVSIMIIIACGFCTDFIIQTMNSMAHEFKLAMFGKMQRAVTIFSFPVFSALITTLGAGCFLYGTIVLLFPPFATFLIMSGIFGILYGFVFLPSLSAQFGFKHGDNLIRICKKHCCHKELDDENDELDDIKEDDQEDNVNRSQQEEPGNESVSSQN